MRPALAALQEQQSTISEMRRTASQITAQNRQAFDSLRRVAVDQGQVIAQLRAQNRQLALGLRAIARMAGVEKQVAQAMFHTADVQNPAQPVPEPPSEPPVQTTQEAETPEAMADVQTPGMVGGSTQDVAADATSTVYTPGMDLPGPAVKNLIDVTRPVDGTQGPQPLSDVRTETDVRVGNPMNPEVAFPLRGEFQQGQSLRGAASKTAAADASSRTMASLRLARLRIATGTAESDNDIEVATTIERDASLSTEAIEREITTLESVTKAAAKAPARPEQRRLVPRSAGGASGVQRTVPSMQATASAAQGRFSTTTTDVEVQDADLFD